MPNETAFDRAKRKQNRQNDIDIGLARDPELREHYENELAADKSNARRAAVGSVVDTAKAPFQSANAFAALALGAYLLTVAVRGNGPALWTMIKGEAGFIKWGIAVSAVWWIATRPGLGEFGASLVAITVLGLAIKAANDPTIINGVVQAWKALPDVKTT